MHPTHNTLSENIRGQSVELLNKHPAAAVDLHGQESGRDAIGLAVTPGDTIAVSRGIDDQPWLVESSLARK
jgi:hypothetical protein